MTRAIITAIFLALPAVAQQTLTLMGEGTGMRINGDGINARCAIPNEFSPPASWVGPTSLIFHCRMNDNADNTTITETTGGGGYNGTATRNTSLSTTSGVINTAIYFNGSDYANHGTSNIFNVQAFTICLWIKPVTRNNWACIISKPLAAGWSNPYACWRVALNDAWPPLIRCPVAATGGSTGGEPPQPTLAVGVWQHYAASYDGATCRSYTNGLYYGSNTINKTLATSTQPVVMGTRSSTTPAEYLNGCIDDIRIYSRALTDAEILSIVQAMSEHD